MSKNILVTGVVLGKESNICSCDYVNFSWMFSHSSNLIWTDNILITGNEMSVVKNSSSHDPYMKAVDIVLTMLQDTGMVKMIPDAEISQDIAGMITDRLLEDLSLLSDMIHVSDNENDPIMSIGDAHFCFPTLWSFYASVYLSFFHDASFSLTRDELVFLNTLIPQKYGKYIEGTGARIAMEEVLSLYLPSIQVGHRYLFESKEKCSTCGNNLRCQDGYLLEIEKQVKAVLEYRQYDEIRQLCNVLDKLCERNSSYDSILTGTELWDDLQDEAKKQENKVRQVLKNISKWQKLSTYASIGLGAASFINPVLGASAAITSVASYILAEKEKRIKKDSSWINFVFNPDQVLKNRPCLH